MADAILTLNAGSSSLKFTVFEAGDGSLAAIASGEVEGIGAAPRFCARVRSGPMQLVTRWTDPDPPFGSLVESVIDWAEAHLGADALIGAGHRVVHGGGAHVAPERVTPGLLAALEALTPLAPLHMEHNLAPIRAIAAVRPKLPQVACFDTAFHHTMPEVATRFALPPAFEAAGVRRYGFHGLSYDYIAGQLRQVAPAVAAGRVIAAHLGNGASLCAMQDGRSVDTTMGFTALDGLMMGTRSGSLDPGVILYLQQQRGMPVAEVEHLLYHDAGLLGVSGLSSDMRVLLASGDPRAAAAIELFVFRIAREIGALTSSLGGLDGLVFTAGIGEHAPPIRARVCARLGWLGVRLDDAANEAGAAVISQADSAIEVRVIATDEDAVIARHTLLRINT